MKVLITGIGGSGKTTIISELKRRGYTGIDLDDTDLCFWINKQTGNRAEYKPGAGSEWLHEHSWRVDIVGLKSLVDTNTPMGDVYVGGKISKSQLKDVSALFDKVFLLRPSDNTLRHRQGTRTNKENKFAQSEDEQNQILENRKNFEDACLSAGAIVVNADKPVSGILQLIL